MGASLLEGHRLADSILMSVAVCYFWKDSSVLESSDKLMVHRISPNDVFTPSVVQKSAKGAPSGAV